MLQVAALSFCMNAHVLILVGSGNHNSHTLNLAMSVQPILEAAGITCHMVDLVDYSLPVYDVDRRQELLQDVKLQTYLELAKKCDGQIWGTTTYHGSFSGILKNALDWQNFSLQGKVVGLIGKSPDGESSALDHLSVVAQHRQALLVPTRVCTKYDDYDGHTAALADQDVLKQVGNFAFDMVSLLELAGRLPDRLA